MRDYEKNTMGHQWAEIWEGEVDIFAYEEGEFHNGPRCVKCGYGFCHHCNPMPSHPCPVGDTGDK